MPDLSATLAAANAAKSNVCPCFNSNRLNKQHPPSTPRPDPPKKMKRGRETPSHWRGHRSGARVYDLYVIRPDDREAAHAEYKRDYGSDPNFAAYAWLNDDDMVIHADAWPRIAHPDKAPSSADIFIDTATIPAIFSNALQEGIFIHEAGHSMGYNHGDKDPSMNSAENLPREERLALFDRIADTWDQVRVQSWYPGLNKRFNDDDLAVN